MQLNPDGVAAARRVYRTVTQPRSAQTKVPRLEDAIQAYLDEAFKVEKEPGPAQIEVDGRKRKRVRLVGPWEAPE